MCALMTTGGLRCWGSNNYGELGEGTMNSALNPVQVHGICSENTSGGTTGSGGSPGTGGRGSTGGNGTVGGGTNGCHSSSDCSQLVSGSSICTRPGAWRCGPVQPDRVGAACTGDADCGGGNICRRTTMPDGGVGSTGLVCVRAVGCTDDSQCVAGQVCREDPSVPSGWLDPTGLVCSAPCATDLDCSPTNKCASDGHCRGRTCAECPSYLLCPDGTCVLASCSSDTECPGGYCVSGVCAGSLGVCQPMCF